MQVSKPKAQKKSSTSKDYTKIFPPEAVKIAQEPRVDFDTMAGRHKQFMVRGSEL